MQPIFLPINVEPCYIILRTFDIVGVKPRPIPTSSPVVGGGL